MRKKKGLLLLLGLLGLALPLAINQTYSPVAAEDYDEDEYVIPEHTEEFDGWRYYTWKFKDFYIADIASHFKAPYGSEYCTSGIEENIIEFVDKILPTIDEFANMGSNATYSMVDVIFNRVIGETRIYANSYTTWEVPCRYFADHIKTTLMDRPIYSIEERTTEFEICAEICVEIYFPSDDYNGSIYQFVFPVKPFKVTPYKDGDVLTLRYQIYAVDDENRMDIWVDYDPYLFDYANGFIIDGSESDYEGLLYTIDFIEKETNIIIQSGEPNLELEPIPSEPFTVFARIRFRSNGVLYEYFSNEVVVEEKVPEILLDGFNNRDTVGIYEEHVLNVQCTIPTENITSAFIRVDYESDDLYFLAEHEWYDPKINVEYQEFPEEIDPDFFNIPFSFNWTGEFIVDFQINVVCQTPGTEFADYFFNSGRIKKKINVVDNPPKYTPYSSALKLDVPERIDCVAGGFAIDISATLAKDLLNDGEQPIFEWHTSRINVIELEQDYNKVKVNPIGGGVVTLTVSCSSSTFEEIKKSVTINVVDDIYSISRLSIPDEFHYSNKDLTVGLEVDRYKDLVNFRPEWQVFDKDDNEVEFVDNHDLTITIQKPEQNDYRIVCLYNGVEIDTQIVEVRNVNVNLYIQQNIWWIFLVTLGFLGIVILFKSLLGKKHSLVDKVAKTNEKFDAIDPQADNVIDQLNKVKTMVIADIEYAKDLNMDAFNQYEKTIRYLNKSLDDIRNIIKCTESMSPAEYDEAYAKLTKNIHKSLAVVSEIESAKEIAFANSMNANQNNITKLEEDNKKKKK